MKRLLLTALLVFPPSIAPAQSGWVKDSRGCRIWYPGAESGDSFKWSGPCVKGVANGRGVMELYSGGKFQRRFEGTLLNGKMNGPGVETQADGVRAQGFFRNSWHPEGFVIIERPNLYRYEGEYRNGAFNGYGTLIWANGNRYEGEFKYGLYHGSGKFTWARGTEYDGPYEEGRPHGVGSYRAADGTTYVGQWIHGCFRQGRIRLTIGKSLPDCGF